MQATIQNEFLSLTVDTHGAEAVSLKNAAGEELLWQADPAVWKRPNGNWRDVQEGCRAKRSSA